MKKVKILFFARLDFFTIFFAVILRPFFNQVVFRNANTFFKNFKVHKYLNLIGIKIVGFKDANYEIHDSSFNERVNLEKKYIKNQVSKNKLVNDFINEYKLDEKQKEKLYLCFRSDLYVTPDRGSEGFTMTIIRNIFPENNYKVYYVPFDIHSYLLLSEVNKKNFSLLSFHLYFHFLCKVFKKINKFLLKLVTKNLITKRKLSFIKDIKIKGNQDKNKISECLLAYLPHGSLKYSEFFKKTYLYSNDRNSPLFKEKILTLFEGDTDKISERYFSKYKIPYSNINSLQDKYFWLTQGLQIIKKIIFLNKNIKNYFSIKEMMFFYIFFRFAYKFTLYNDILSKLKLKVLYSHYGSLVSSHLILACDYRKITTIALQDRPNHYLFFNPLFFNKLLISGEGFLPILKEKGYLCDNYGIIGTPRASLIEQSMDTTNKKIKKYIEIKKTKKIIACFGLNIISDYQLWLDGEDGSSYKSNVSFLKSILKLAKKFNQAYFIVRFKNEKTSFLMQKEVLLEAEKTKNIEVHRNLKEIKSYDIASISDIIIGKQTSILEESLAAGKKVVFYDDNENYMEKLNFPTYKVNQLLQNSYADLEKRIEEILDNKYDTSEEIKKFVEKYYSRSLSKKSFKILRDEVIKAL